MEEEKNEIKKQFIFNGKDFNNWKFRMEVLLREHDAESFIEKSLEEFEEIAIDHLDDAATRTRKEKLREELRKKERKCKELATITSSMSKIKPIRKRHGHRYVVISSGKVY